MTVGVSGHQMRAARAIIGANQADIAAAAGVTRQTIGALNDRARWRRNSDQFRKLRAEPFVVRCASISAAVLDHIITAVIASTDAARICGRQAGRIRPLNPWRD
jgi:hypothetical protein